MKLNEIIEKTGFTLSTKNMSTDVEVNGVYCGDLLSWVMGRGEPEQAWITVQVHPNVIAVALLREFSCVIIADGAFVTEDLIRKAEDEQLIILESSLPVYETAQKLNALGL